MHRQPARDVHAETFRAIARDLVVLAANAQMRALPVADIEPADLTSHVPYDGELGDGAFSYSG
jgi:hypothetical protein